MKINLKKNNSKSNQAGFSLVELLLYIALSSTILLILSTTIFSLLQARIKGQAIAEVEQQGVQIMQLLKKSLRQASSITSPTVGTSGSSLNLIMPTPAVSPTIISLSGNTMTMTEGANPVLNLSSNRLVVSNLMFGNWAKASTPGLMRISFTLSYVNNENRQEYNYSQTFVGSVAKRY